VARAMANVLRGSWPTGRELNNPAIKEMATARWRAREG